MTLYEPKVGDKVRVDGELDVWTVHSTACTIPGCQCSWEIRRGEIRNGSTARVVMLRRLVPVS